MEIPFSGLYTLTAITNRLVEDLRSLSSEFDRVKETVILCSFILDRISPNDPNLLKVCRTFYQYIRQIHMYGSQLKSISFFTKFYIKPIKEVETRLLIFIKDITPSLDLQPKNVPKTNNITIDITDFPENTPEWIFQRLEPSGEDNMWSYKLENNTKYWFKTDGKEWTWRQAGDAWNTSPWIATPEVVVPPGPWKTETPIIEIQRFIKWLGFVNPIAPL